MRKFLWLCVTAGAISTTTPPRAAKREAVEKAAESARGAEAAMLAKRCVYQVKADAAKPPRKITIELPASPSSGQAAPAEADDSDSPPHDEEQPDVITNEA